MIFGCDLNPSAYRAEKRHVFKIIIICVTVTVDVEISGIHSGIRVCPFSYETAEKLLNLIFGYNRLIIVFIVSG